MGVDGTQAFIDEIYKLAESNGLPSESFRSSLSEFSADEVRSHLSEAEKFLSTTLGSESGVNAIFTNGRVTCPIDEGTFLSVDLHLLESIELKKRTKHIVEIIEEVKWEDVDPDMLTSHFAKRLAYDKNVLEGVIKYRWNALPVEQRDGMKNFISDIIVQLSSNEASFRAERLYVSKLNIILVQILKHEWPARWRSFIPDLVSAAKTSETICENCMAILKLLSEEVFDFSRGEMTQQKIKELK
ncbi:hypothetical protein KIW84_052417 [Lathyrus oleraceus]|uniref:Uncharacterized protein n=1 Tax=Pisum sativum TaxID=3888 RepID=A0A9D4WPY0_PEA|nr:hypothetical protein KIW84_052417 [Pisum sativum]